MDERTTRLLDKCEAMSLLCNKATSYWSMIKFFFQLPLIFTSAIMCVLNALEDDTENTMRIQDSLYYQDFSYVIKVGRSITEWRDSFKKTMHTAGFYYAGEVNTETRLNAQIK